MRIVFAGTPDFAARALGALLDVAPDNGWAIPLVLTQPDRPAGRGMKQVASPVRQLADGHLIDVATPVSLRKGDDAVAATAQLRALAPDVLVVAAYGLILPQAVLDIPRHGAINIHASLLPRWRGAAPIARAIEAGDRETGVTIMQMDAGLDTGAMLLTRSIPITDDATTGSLTLQLANLGAALIIEALRSIESLPRTPQPSEGASYAPKIQKVEARLDWTESSEQLARRVRAFDPFPVATAMLEGQLLRLWRARALSTPSVAAPGTVVAATADGLRVACGTGELLVTELQRPGGRRLSARDFVQGSSPKVGARFEPVRVHD